MVPISNNNNNNSSTGNTTTTTNVGGGDGCWIGIDIGTTNCAVAVYDRTRGSSKWIRLRNIATYDTTKNKIGRIIPSVILLATQQYVHAMYDNDNPNNNWIDISHLFITIQQQQQPSTNNNRNKKLYACVGAAAIQFINNNPRKRNVSDEINDNTKSLSSDRIEAATLRNFKRTLLITTSKNVNTDNNDTSSNDPLSIPVSPLGMDDTITVSAIDAITILLYVIRIASDEYLHKNIRSQQ